MQQPVRPIAEYAAARASQAQHSDDINGAQPGDPAKAAAAMIAQYEQASAPQHLFLGSDAVAMAETKLRAVQAEVEALRAVSVATDF
jgi:hypothetical protein